MRLLLLLVAIAVVMAGAIAPHTAEGASRIARPKAVIIVGPVGGLTSDFLATGRRVAAQAKAAGMRVRRVFHPAATWDNVLARIQGANLVVYLGHGNGWPSPHAPFQEDTKNGFGLDLSVGASSYSVDYRGATSLRASVRLAPPAVVVIYRACYAAGNGERWMGPERNRAIAAERVDNYAAGFLDIGAAAVFAFGTTQAINIPQALARSSMTMDQVFRTRGSSRASMYDGFQGTDDYRVPSSRTPGARSHLDPHRYRGHLRAVTGDLRMTAAQWRGQTSKKDRQGRKNADKVRSNRKARKDTQPPRLTDVSVVSRGALDPASSSVPQLSPDGDGMGDRLRIARTVSEKSDLTVVIRNEAGKKARTLSQKARAGPGTIAWDGRYRSGRTVPDGLYTLELVARDRAGNKSRPRTVRVRVATTLRGYRVSMRAIHAADEDRMARQVRLRVDVTRRATVLWRIQNAEGRTVRILRDRDVMRPGTLERTWDGRNDKGRFVSRGLYTATVVATTADSTVRYQQHIWVGPYRIVTDQDAARRGERITVTYRSTESLRKPPKVTVKQPGIEPYELETSKVGKDLYRLTFKPRAKGKAGDMSLTIRGRDPRGGKEEHTHSIRLR